MAGRDEVFGRVADVVGDLDSPFYAEERQREVWNEASAVGLQAMLWGVTALACAMAWLGGPAGAGWSIGLLAVAGAGSWMTVGHARRHGVSGLEDTRMARTRVGIWLALYVATLVGVGYQLLGDMPGNMAAGAVVGAVVGAVLGLVALFLGTRRESARDTGE